MSTSTPLFDLADRQMADTSLQAFDTLRPKLGALELEVFKAIHAYIADTGYPDVSGGELAKWLGWEVTSTRPRIRGLLRKSYVEKGPLRASRAGELTVRGVRPVLSLAAVDRAGIGKAE